MRCPRFDPAAGPGAPMTEQLDLALVSDADVVLRALPASVRELWRTTRLPSWRVAQCLRWLERRGDVVCEDNWPERIAATGLRWRRSDG